MIAPRLLGRHQIAAAIGTSTDFATMIALVEVAHVDAPLATMLSALAGGLVNFTVSRRWAFREIHRGALPAQAAKYAVVSLGGALLNSLLLAVALHTLPVSYVVARVGVAVAVSLLYSYPLHTRLVFRVEPASR